jgi:glycosyltransferase involved in cell wall biosynthesis
MAEVIAYYRTVYFLASEAFIPAQIASLVRFSYQVWMRDQTPEARSSVSSSSAIVPLVSPGGFMRRVRFTLCGRPAHELESHLEPALIHAHFGPDASMVLPLAKRARIPLVVTFHGFDAQRSRLALLVEFKPSNLLFLIRERQLYRYAARVIAVSEYMKGCLIRRGCPADKITVHYIGVDTRKFIPDHRCRKPFRIVNVSRHIPLKGIDTILRALSLIAGWFPEAKLIQVGAGSESASLANLAKNLGIADRVTWLGEQPNDRVLEAMQSSSVYVQASRRDEAGQTEAFGIALLEAQACGLPVVATNSGGMPEAMVDGETGFLFEENDHGGLADRLGELLANPEKIRDMGQRAREMVVQRFDIRARTAVLEQIYDEVLASNRR